jgi:biopolymer transport protein ExbD
MPRRRYASNDFEQDINITPLMDITFIMLIFFIVTSTFVKEPGVEINRPEAQTAEERRLASILVAIDAENEIWINKEKVPIEQVRTTVLQMRQENPKGTAVVQVDARARSKLLVDVVNEIRDAGVDDIAVSTEEPT